MHVILVAGPKDHGPGEHDYPAWQKAWQKLLSKSKNTQVTTAWDKPSVDDLKSADVLVIFKHTSWPMELNNEVDAFIERGGGIVLLHFAVDCNHNRHAGETLGLFWGPGARFRHGRVDLEFEKDDKNPFLHGLSGKTFRFHDESYWRLTGEPSSIDVLASAMEDDGDGKKVRVPLIWNRQVGKGRIHVNIFGHYNWTFNDPVFRAVVLRGVAWAAHQPVHRFDDLVMTDLRLREPPHRVPKP
jgi:type 1 glutamine amidotransferase